MGLSIWQSWLLNLLALAAAGLAAAYVWFEMERQQLSDTYQERQQFMVTAAGNNQAMGDLLTHLKQVMTTENDQDLYLTLKRHGFNIKPSAYSPARVWK